MLTANDVRNVTFARAARGYKINEVDDFLEQVVETVDQLHSENAELIRKLEVLADRIQEYRNEEDSIRSALLTAQKSADKILKEATEEKERILADARQQADDAVRLSQEKSVTIANETREKVSHVLTEAKEKAARIMSEAKSQSEQMLAESIEGCKLEKQYLEFLKEQEATFRQQLVEMYKKQFEMMKKGPELLKELDKKIAEREEPISLKQSFAEDAAPKTPTVTEEQQSVTEEINTPEYSEPEDVPLPVAKVPVEAETSTIDNGFEIKRKFSDIKFGDDYDISADDDYDDYGV